MISVHSNVADTFTLSRKRKEAGVVTSNAADAATLVVAGIAILIESDREILRIRRGEGKSRRAEHRIGSVMRRWSRYVLNLPYVPLQTMTLGKLGYWVLAPSLTHLHPSKALRSLQTFCNRLVEANQ